MSVDYAQLIPGQQISHRTCSLDADTVSKYVEAVGDLSWPTYQTGDRVVAPPMAVAALWLRGVVNDLAIPGGTLHIGQELDFHGAVHVGETLDCRATLLQNSVRRGVRFMVVEADVADGTGRKVMGGKGTITVPAG